MKLTKKQKEILMLLWNGADVYNLGTAQFLREAEKEGLVEICKPQADVPGEKQQPYFGCILTAKGRGVTTIQQRRLNVGMEIRAYRKSWPRKL